MRRSTKLQHQVDISVDAKDAADLRTLLGNLKPRVARKLIKEAVVAAGRIVARQAKDLAPKDTGLLKKSIGVKGVLYPSGTAVAVIGPRKGFGREVVRDGFKMYADPVKYAHLVELGHVIRRAKKGPVLGFVSARPFLRPAWMQSKARARAKMASQLRRGVAREAAKMAKKS